MSLTVITRLQNWLLLLIKTTGLLSSQCFSMTAVTLMAVCGGKRWDIFLSGQILVDSLDSLDISIWKNKCDIIAQA